MALSLRAIDLIREGAQLSNERRELIGKIVHIETRLREIDAEVNIYTEKMGIVIRHATEADEWNKIFTYRDKAERMRAESRERSRVKALRELEGR